MKWYIYDPNYETIQISTGRTAKEAAAKVVRDSWRRHPEFAHENFDDAVQARLDEFQFIPETDTGTIEAMMGFMVARDGLIGG